MFESMVFADSSLKDLQDELVCPICYGYVQQTGIECNKCQKIQCKNCYQINIEQLTRNAHCPSCKQGGSALKNHREIGRILKKMIDKIQFKCKRCNETFSEASYLSHRPSCQVQKKCPYDGCQLMLNQAEMTSHILDHKCPHRLLQCNDCDFQGTVLQSKSHTCYYESTIFYLLDICCEKQDQITGNNSGIQ